MEEYQLLGHMTRITEMKQQEVLSSGRSQSLITSVPTYYLPHHGVLKPESATTKLRVVFNGSSSSSSGLSLNDIMHSGPNLLLNIDVLIWVSRSHFRSLHRHVFATNITKMYRQIQVHPDDWNYQRVLWVDRQLNETQFNLTTVTYGLRAAPYLAVRTLLQLVQDEGHKFPLAIPSIMHGRYVDDIFGGADTEEQLIETARQLVQLCHAGGFLLAKWHSTNQELLQEISSTELMNEGITFDDCNAKILGITWSPHKDEFQFTSLSAQNHGRYSKRIVLSEVARIFDPLGCASPVVVRAKILLQEIWLLKLSWDDPLPFHITSQWLHIKTDFSSLAKLTVPRWINTLSTVSVTFHGFSDASQFAMVAVVYLVVNSPSTGAKSSIIVSKTKVAPIKRFTIPRLELSAALLLSKLISYVRTVLPTNIMTTYLWTDSQVSLTWIRSHPSCWKEFIKNCVAQIQELSQDAVWKHVPGSQNPADCASRGISTEQLLSHQLWWTGPPWLLKSDEHWPKQPAESDPSSTLESRPGVTLTVTQKRVEYHWDIIYRYSSINRLLRVTSLCFRFASRLKNTFKKLSPSELSAADVEQSRVFWVMATQAVWFSTEIKALNQGSQLPSTHPFSRLTAFIDQDGVIRVGGQLSHASVAYEEKHQAILPHEARLTELLIDDAHQRTMHGGIQLTLTHLRQRYWIIGGRRAMKSHILRCITCVRYRGLRGQQLIRQLPSPRVSPSRAFSHTGIDYSGPLTLKSWARRGAKMFKGWICVFVCFSTSAVHIEVVSDYSTQGFIATYKRFVSRRGIPHTLYSDCGTNFIGADAQLQLMFSQLSKENHEIASLFARDKTLWNFNPPSAPHMGGK